MNSRMRMMAEKYGVTTDEVREVNRLIPEGCDWHERRAYARGWVISNLQHIAEAHAGCEREDCRICEEIRSAVAMLLAVSLAVEIEPSESTEDTQRGEPTVDGAS